MGFFSLFFLGITSLQVVISFMHLPLKPQACPLKRDERRAWISYWAPPALTLLMLRGSRRHLEQQQTQTGERRLRVEEREKRKVLSNLNKWVYVKGRAEKIQIKARRSENKHFSSFLSYCFGSWKHLSSLHPTDMGSLGLMEPRWNARKTTHAG